MAPTATNDATLAVRVLIIDDNKGDYVLARTMLEQVEGSHYDVDWVADPEEALRVMSGSTHDVCLLDHQLGARTGLQLLGEAERFGTNQPIIMLTGVSNPAVDRAAMKAGAADYLIKSELTGPMLERSIRYALERHQLLMALEAAAKHDALTGLANRRDFLDFLDGAIARARRSHKRLGVLFIDLDHFKEINDQLGHNAGDQVLAGVAGELERCVRRGDLVARLGGDEFAVILDDITQVEDVVHVAQKILDALAAHPFEAEGVPVLVGSSIGAAVFPNDADDAASIVKAADTAMYEAKAKGRNRYQCFEASMQTKAVRRAELHRALDVAVGGPELSLVYQPQVRLHPERLVGVEALLRWRHAGADISPNEFIPIAEESGLICRIGETVLHTACQQYQAWRAKNYLPDAFKLAVNVSVEQLSQGGLFSCVASTLASTGIDPSVLELEITETRAMRNPGQAVQELNRVRELGVQLALDDFGTGQSTLGYLKSLPIQTLKIDRMFVENVGIDTAGDGVLVKATLALAHALGLTAVAEGVETEVQRRFLDDNGCDVLQGYFFHRPLGSADLERLLRRDHPQNHPESLRLAAT